MKPTLANITKVILVSAVFSFLPGVLFASIYTTFKDGFSQEKVDSFEMLDFWRYTPFETDAWTLEFDIILLVFGGTMTGSVVLGLVLSFPRQMNSHGSAKWASHREMIKLGYLLPYKQILGPVFGKSTGPKAMGKYLSSGNHAHSLIVAPTRAGKGVGVVIPTLLTFNGSVVVLDVKGELFDLTSRAREARGDRVYKFNPLDESGITHRYNPIDDIASLPRARQFTAARRLAANLIIAKSKSAEGFVEGARDLFAAGVVSVIERGTPTVGAIYALFSQPGDKSDLFANLAIESQSEEARGIFDNMAGNDLKIITSYTSVLGDGGLNLWADPLIQRATETSDFSIRTLRSEPSSIYLCVNANDIIVLSPLMRLLFQQMVSTLQNRLPEEDDVFEVLFLLDEFKSLGKMSLIETAITTLAGFGGRFMIVVQNLSNLTEIYGPAGKENFLGNCGVQVFMATADAETPQYISKAIGDFTRKARSKSWSSNDPFSGSSIQEREEGSRLIRPEEIRLLPNEEEIVLLTGEPPLRLRKIRYYEDNVFKKVFEQQQGDLPLPEPLKLEASECEVSEKLDEKTQPDELEANVAPKREEIEETIAETEKEVLFSASEVNKTLFGKLSFS